MLIVFVLLLIPLLPTLWAIVDLPKRRFSRTKWKVIWFALVATLPFLGAIVYFALVRRHTEPL
ncbi:MAG: PLDc N-terminal domain-containing protein [Syntrophobacteraceae bacterium]